MSAIFPVPTLPADDAESGRARGIRYGAAAGAGLLVAAAAGAGAVLPHEATVYSIAPCLALALAGAAAAWWAMRALLAPLQSEIARLRADAAGHAGVRDGRRSDELLNLLYEQSPLGLTLRHLDGPLIRCNAAFARLIGYGEEELRGLDRYALVPPECREARSQARADLLQRGSFGPYDTELLNRDGVRVPVRISGVRTRGADGEPLFWSIVEDVTARKQMMEALKHSESEGRMLAAVASSTNNMVVICDREGRIEWVNHAFESVTGHARRDAVGMRPGDLLQGPDTDPAVVARMRASIASLRSFEAELVNYARDGRAYWVALECAPVFDHAGDLERYVAIGRDITETRSVHRALSESEERFRDLTELSSDWFWEQDEDFRFVQMTEFGRGSMPSRLRLGTRPWEDSRSLLAPEAWARHRAELDAHLPFTDFENAVALEDGRVMWRSTSGKPLFDAAGNFKGYRGVGRDITARKQVMEALRQSESEGRMLSVVASNTNNMVVICDRQGRIEWVNQAFQAVTGYGRQEAVGVRPGALLQGPDTDAATVAQMREGLASKQAFNAELLNYAKDGRAYWVALEYAPVFDYAGELERYVAIGRDITQARSMNLALAQSEERFRDLTELSSDWFWERDEDLRLVHITNVKDGMTRSRLQPGTRPWSGGDSLLPPEAWVRHRADLEAHLPFTDFENSVRLEDGSVVWRSISGKPLFDAAGNFKGYRGVGRDITARKEAEEIIQESKRMYRRVVESVRDVIFQIDDRGNFVFLNHAWSQSTGFGVESAIGRPIFEYVHPDDREAARRIVGEVAAEIGKYTQTAGRMRTSDGSHRWFEVELQSHAEPDGSRVIAGTLHDVTRERAAQAERRAAEAALREVQARYSRALAGANDGAWELELRAGTYFISERMEDLLGVAAGEGPRNGMEFRSIVHPQDLALHLRNTDDMLHTSGPRNWDLRLRRGDGSFRWFRIRGMASFDNDGTPLLTSGTLTDIDAAKRAEQELKRHRDDLAGLVEERTASAESARAEAEKAQRVAESANRSKSEFLANMSHELRTPMHAIMSFASFGVDKAARAERDKLAHYFGNIHKSGARLLTLLNDLLDLSKLEAGKMEMRLAAVDPAGLIRDAMSEAEALARSREVRLVLDAPEQPLTARLDGPRMIQVIANLLSNAIKFSPPGGAVALSLRSTAAGLEIRVKDQGIGIPEDELEAVFDKFVQSSKTKTGAGGTGLGLAICREIVHAHRGSIVAANNPPPAAGACFSICIPRRVEHD